MITIHALEFLTIYHVRFRDDQSYVEHWQVDILKLMMMIIIDESIKDKKNWTINWAEIVQRFPALMASWYELVEW